MSGFWSDALLSVQNRLDAKTEGLAEHLTSLGSTVAAKLEAVQEAVAADVESFRAEHSRMVDAGGDDAADDGPYAGQGDALPWEARDEAKAILAADLKRLVLDLSLDDRTFTEPPPPEAHYAFDVPRGRVSERERQSVKQIANA